MKLQLGRHSLKVKGFKKILHANGNENKAEVAIFTSDKRDFKKRAVTRDKKEHFITIKGSTPQKAVSLVNAYAPTKGAPTSIEQRLVDITEEMEKITVIEADF